MALQITRGEVYERIAEVDEKTSFVVEALMYMWLALFLINGMALAVAH